MKKHDPIAEAESANQQEPIQNREKRRGRRILIGLLLAISAIAVIQHRAPSWDHQFANLITIVIVIATTIQLVWNLHWIAVKHRMKWHVPLALLVATAVAPILFDFEGFSGELIPQIRLSIGKRAPKIQETLASQEIAAPTETDEASDVSSDTQSSASDRRYALDDFPQFLGPQRNGVVSVRHFAIPDQPTNVELLWNIGVGAGWASFAVVQDRAITLEQRDDQECLTCYRLSDGALLWKVQHDSFHDETFGGAGPRSTPTIFEGHVYAQGQDGTVWCVDWLTGNMVWKVELLELAEWNKESSEQAITWARAGSPLIVDGLCILPFGGPDQQSSEGRSLIALSITDGSIQWRSGKDQISYASPMLATLAGQRQIVSVNEKTITGHQVETGQVIWSFPWMGQSNGGANCASIMVAGADQFLIGKGYGGGSALVQITNQDNGKQMADAIWTSSRILKTKFTHACVDGPIAYAINNGSLEAVNIAEGISNWQQPRRDRLGQGQLLLVDDTLIGQSESGEIVLSAANPDEYVELIRIPAMRSKTWNIPTIAGRHLIVRNDRQAFCFLLPKRDDTLAP
jgi:outer membrane protein assembly factor BamB